MTTTAEPQTDAETATARSDVRLRRTLWVIIAVALALVVGTGGWALGHRTATDSMPSTSSVDAGFARDMAVHHQQAVIMARYERLYTTNPDLQLLAYNIEDTQMLQIGQLHGWLQTWGLGLQDHGAPMSWMKGMDMQLGPNDLMPGMATPAQMSELEAARGTKLDKLFLTDMIKHHQGGVAMAQYAADHASASYVRALAEAMVATQSDEIVQMEQALRAMGGST